MTALIHTAALLPLAKSSGSFLVSPALGLMVWTLLVFGVTMFVLGRAALPRIGAELDKRARAIRESIEAAEKQRKESEELLAEYRQRLSDARQQADDIVARARKASEAALAEAAATGKEKREELVAAARRDIELETKRSLERIRKEVADLTVAATEKVTRKALDEDDQRPDHQPQRRGDEEAAARARQRQERDGGGEAQEGVRK